MEFPFSDIFVYKVKWNADFASDMLIVVLYTLSDALSSRLAYK